jgi:hypothetical protein
VNQSELIDLIAMPQQASSADMAKLQSLKKQFPFFQSAHLLLSLVSKRHDSGLFQQTLKSTAISVPNRSRLYFLLNNAELFTKTTVVNLKKDDAGVEEVKMKTTEIEHLKAIETEVEKKNVVNEEELNKQVEKELEKEVAAAIVEKQILKVAEKKKEEKKEKITSGSFTDWLKNLKSETAEEDRVIEVREIKKPEPVQPNIERKKEQKALIDKIIESNPGNIRLKEGQKFYTSDANAKESLLESEDLVTETLAKIYAMQGNISKAIRAYEILSLKFPQKSAYFASLIENLKKGNS